jgi:hypothetical protein
MASKQSSPSFLALPTLRSLPRLEPLCFPTFKELVKEHQLTQEMPRRQDPGLFQALLGAQPQILHAALVDDPDMFDPRTAALLLELMTGRRTVASLSPEEMNLLNAATAEFAQHRKPPAKLKELLRQPAPLDADQSDDSDYEGDLEWNERGGGPSPATNLKTAASHAHEVDETTLPTRWWEKS